MTARYWALAYLSKGKQDAEGHQNRHANAVMKFSNKVIDANLLNNEQLVIELLDAVKHRHFRMK